MGSDNLKYSKTKIDKAGEYLKGDVLDHTEVEIALEVLSKWRAFHAPVMALFAKVLKSRVKKINSKSIVAQRLKRTPSILLKLNTHQTMRLSTMQDIGGLRTVFDSVDEVYKLIDLYRLSKTRHELFALSDYIDSPKSDGYRGIHLVYKVDRNPKIFIEIQVRSYLQHIWATAVEVFGTLKTSSFKSGYGDQAWLEFFALLSSVFAIKEKCSIMKNHQLFSQKQLLKKLRKCISDLKAIEQLSVYTTIYKITSNENRGKKGSYSLITLNSRDNTINVNGFSVSEIDQATDSYIELEKKYYDDININVVLVNVGDVKKLETSYPNYFMDTKVLVRYLSQIVLEKFIKSDD